MGEAKRRKSAGGSGPVQLIPVRQPKPIRELQIPSTAAAIVTPEMLRYLVGLAEEIRLMARTALSGIGGAEPGPLLAAVRRIGAASGEALEQQIARHRAALPAFAADLDAVECKSGCTWCCHLGVEVTVLEALRIFDAMAAGAVPDRGAAIDAAAAELAGLSREARRRQGAPCPLLLDGACSAYAVRPLACRALLSLDAGSCAADFTAGLAGQERPAVPSLALPMLIGTAIFSGQVAALADFRLASHGVELAASLALLARDATALERWLGGEDVFPRLI